MRKDVWLYLLGHYQFGDTSDARARADAAAAEAYAAACAHCARLTVQGDAYVESDLAFNTQVRNIEDGKKLDWWLAGLCWVWLGIAGL